MLVTSLPFAGHTGPMAAITGELVRRGHEVVAYTGAKYRGRFEAVGARWLPWREATDFDDADLGATFPRIGDGKGLRADRANVTDLLFGTAPGQAADIRAAAAGTPFDLIVADQLALGGMLAGEALGLRWVSIAVTPLSLASRDLPPPGLPLRPATGRPGRLRDAVLRRLLTPVHRWTVGPMLNRARAAAGLGPAPAVGWDSLYSPYLVVAQGVPGLEYPRSDLPPHVHLVGRLAPGVGLSVEAAPGAGLPAGAVPAWWPELAAARAAGRPVVHVTQGTLATDPDDLLRPAIVGLSDLVVPPLGASPLVVCATGGAPETVLGPLPANVRAATFLPHDALLPQVDLVVTNGGWGGVLAALHAGVPLVVAGSALDKPEVARRVAWSGAGIDLRTGAPGARLVRRAVARALADPGLRRRAGELSTALSAAGGVPAAVDLITAVAMGTGSAPGR